MAGEIRLSFDELSHLEPFIIVLEPSLRTALVRLRICRSSDPHVLTCVCVESMQCVEGARREEDPINRSLTSSATTSTYSFELAITIVIVRQYFSLIFLCVWVDGGAQLKTQATHLVRRSTTDLSLVKLPGFRFGFDILGGIDGREGKNSCVHFLASNLRRSPDLEPWPAVFRHLFCCFFSIYPRNVLDG